MCAVTRQPLAVEALLRFVAGPDGVLVPDIRRRLPGRGANVALSARVLAEAIRRKSFARALRQPVEVPTALVEDVRGLLKRDALQALALANKAGLVVTGFAKAEERLRAGKAAALLSAADGAEDGRRKLLQAAHAAPAGSGAATPVVLSFTSDDFQLALGRDLVIHAALLPGPAAEGFLVRWRRLVRYENEPLPAVAARAPRSTDELPEHPPAPDRTAGPNAE